MSLKHLMQRITSMNGIDIPDSEHSRIPAGEIRAALAEAAAMRRERDEWERIASAFSPQKELATALKQAKESGRKARNERDELARQNAELAARLAEIEAQEPVAWEYDCLGWEPVMSTYRRDVNEFSPTARERPLYARPVPAQAAAPERAEPVAWVPVHPREGALWSMTTATPSEERLPSHYPLSPLYTSPAPAAAPERAELSDIEAVLRGAVDRAVDQCADATGQRAKVATFVNRTEIVNAAIAQICSAALADARRDGADAMREAEIDRLIEAGRAHIRRAAAFEAQRDDLLSCLRDCVEYVDEEGLKHVAAYGEHHHAARLARVREDAKKARAAISRADGGASASARAEPADGCGACGDACRSRGSCRLADESPEHKA